MEQMRMMTAATADTTEYGEIRRMRNRMIGEFLAEEMFGVVSLNHIFFRRFAEHRNDPRGFAALLSALYIVFSMHEEAEEKALTNVYGIFWNKVVDKSAEFCTDDGVTFRSVYGSLGKVAR